MDGLDAFQKNLGVEFSDLAHLRRALTHRSYVNEHPDQALEDNQRLEFLGDAVLDFISGEMLYHRFPDAPEGKLTRLRSALVRTETLANLARRSHLNRVLLLGRGEEDNGGRDRNGNLCDAFEALVGALYLDQGMKKAEDFVTPLFNEALTYILKLESDKDAKSRLQEWSQQYLDLIPVYQTVLSEGPDHAKEFTVAIYIGGQEQTRAKGSSKRAAAQAAAEIVLNNLDTLLAHLQREEQ
jgi:ribonuclease-3